MLKISGPERELLPPDGSYTPAFREASMSEQSTTSSVVYKDIPGFPGYRAGSDGTIWSCWQATGRASRLTNHWRLMKQCLSPNGYLTIGLRKDKKGFLCQVHRLVLMAFAGSCPGKIVCHYDGNPINNRIENLRWGTQADNAADRARHARDGVGIRNGRAKVTGESVLDIRQKVADGASVQEMAEKYKIGHSTALHIVRGDTWKHIGGPVTLEPIERSRCNKGHLLTEENTIVEQANGKVVRRCRECRRKSAGRLANIRDQRLQCSVCSLIFLGNRKQFTRLVMGKPVTCSNGCRSRLAHKLRFGDIAKKGSDCPDVWMVFPWG